MNGILTVAVDGTHYNLLDDYGKITDLQVEAAQMARNTVDASPRAKQNSQMMYKCLVASNHQGGQISTRIKGPGLPRRWPVPVLSCGESTLHRHILKCTGDM